MKEKIKREVERVKKFNRVVPGNTNEITIVDIDVRNYAKYILRDGTDLEKRELLACLKNKIILTNRIVNI